MQTHADVSGNLLARFNALHGSILQIVASPAVKQFCVGITGNPTQRRGRYARWCKSYKGNLDGFAVLDWQHDRTSVIQLEGWITRKIFDHPKYAGDHLYRPNVSKLPSQYFYVAWWSPAFWQSE